MRILAIIFPPLAALFAGGIISFLLNCLLTMCFYLPGAIHAWGLVSDKKADKRTDRLIKAQAKLASKQNNSN